MTSINALATLLEAFFADTHAHTDTKALLHPCCACAHGVPFQSASLQSAFYIRSILQFPTLIRICMKEYIVQGWHVQLLSLSKWFLNTDICIKVYM